MGRYTPPGKPGKKGKLFGKLDAFALGAGLIVGAVLNMGALPPAQPDEPDVRTAGYTCADAVIGVAVDWRTCAADVDFDPQMGACADAVVAVECKRIERARCVVVSFADGNVATICNREP